jgi:hypothetical protein
MAEELVPMWWEVGAGDGQVYTQEILDEVVNKRGHVSFYSLEHGVWGGNVLITGAEVLNGGCRARFTANVPKAVARELVGREGYNASIAPPIEL